MTIKIQIAAEIADAVCTKFGYDQKTENEKKELTKADFVIGKIAEYLKKEAGEHLAMEAASAASKAAKELIETKQINKVD